MMRITFLGTSSAKPTPERNFPSMSLYYDGRIYLFDCGEGTQRQMIKYNINPFRIDSIFITHVHNDHVLGLPGLLRTLSLNKRVQPIRIYVPKGYENVLGRLLFYDNDKMGYRVEIIGVAAGRILQGKQFEVRAFKVRHSIDTYGYVFEERSRVRFFKERCKRLGMRGEDFKRILKEGTIRKNGKAIRLKAVTYTTESRKVAYIMDTRPVPAAVKNYAGAELLVHEATYGNDRAELAKEHMHSTAQECAALAKRAKVKRLMLTHLSSRYKSHLPLEREARKVFPKARFAWDGMEILIGGS